MLGKFGLVQVFALFFSTTNQTGFPFGGSFDSEVWINLKKTQTELRVQFGTVSTMSTRVSRHCYQASTNQLLNHYDVYNIYSLYSLYKDFQGLLMLHMVLSHFSSHINSLIHR